MGARLKSTTYIYTVLHHTYILEVTLYSKRPRFNCSRTLHIQHIPTIFAHSKHSRTHDIDIASPPCLQCNISKKLNRTSNLHLSPMRMPSWVTLLHRTPSCLPHSPNFHPHFPIPLSAPTPPNPSLPANQPPPPRPSPAASTAWKRALPSTTPTHTTR